MCLLISCLLLNGCTCKFKYDDHISVIMHSSKGFDLGITAQAFPFYYQREIIGNLRLRELNPEIAFLDDYKDIYRDLDNGKFHIVEKTVTYTMLASGDFNHSASGHFDQLSSE